MKLSLCILPLVALVRGEDEPEARWPQDIQFQIFWITSSNGANPDYWQYSERHQIGHFRTKYLAPWFGPWADWMDNIEWNWILYGEASENPCQEWHGPYAKWAELEEEMARVNEAGEPTYMSEGTYHHVGWDVAANSMNGRDLKKSRWIVIWENMVYEDVNTMPYPAYVDLAKICGQELLPGATSMGHTTFQLFRNTFPTNNQRLFLVNYGDARPTMKYEDAFEINMPTVTFQADYMPTNNDIEDTRPDYWLDRGYIIQTRMQYFMALAMSRGADPELNSEDPADMKIWSEVYWPRWLEVYGKNATKKWKIKYWEEDDHPENVVAYEQYLLRNSY